MKYVGLLKQKGLVKVFLAFEKLVKGPGGKFGLLGDLLHGDIVIPLLRKKPKRGRKHLFALS